MLSYNGVWFKNISTLKYYLYLQITCSNAKKKKARLAILCKYGFTSDLYALIKIFKHKLVL